MKVASLFSGVGGLDYGFHHNPFFEIVFANDFEPNACKTYLKNFEGAEKYLKEGDIEKLVNDIPQHDVIIGGFPCQAFTLAGSRKGFEDDAVSLKTKEPLKRGLQYQNCIKDLQLKQPKFFFFENVKGILSHAFKDSNDQVIKTIDVIMDDFKAAGYNVFYKLAKMADYGVPQKRERVIFIGTRSDLDINPELLFPEPPKVIDRDLKLKANLIFGDPRESQYTNHNYHTGNSKGTKMGWIKVLLEGENLVDLTQDEIDTRCDSAGIERRVKPNSVMGYRRLHGDQIAPTMMFGNTCLPIHPYEDRSISVREAAYIQGFPKDFVFMGGVASQYKQVGNAVPPIFSKFLANHLADFCKKLS